MLVDSTAAICFSIIDDLAFVFAHELVLSDVLTSVQTQAVDTAVSKKSVFRYTALYTCIATPAYQNTIVVDIDGIEDIAHATRVAEVWIALSA